MKKTTILLLIFICINFALNLYGNNWGLPSRWHSDERVTNVLHMADRRTLVDVDNEFFEPTGYQILLLIWFVPFFTWLKLIHFPLDKLKEAASVSWHHMANLFPDFATNIYIYARALSAIMGVITVYLIYVLGKEIYNKKVGLFSAAFLSVCMGFVGVNHLAKYASFLNLLIVLTLILLVKNLIYPASFFAGLALSIHFNAVLLLIPLFSASVFNFDRWNRTISVSLKLFILYAAGIIIGTPSAITHFREYAIKFEILFKSLFSPLNLYSIQRGLETKDTIFAGPINYFFEIWKINGIFIFALILIGIILTALRWRRISKKEMILFSYLIPCFLVMTVFLSSKTPEQKYIIAIIPLLVLFAGKTMFEFCNIKFLPGFIKYGLFSLILLYSFAYSLAGDLVFVRGDTRYQTTKWIFENVPEGSKIELFDQIHYVCSDEVMNYYEIIYFGRSEKDFVGRRFFKWNTVEGREVYLQFINKYDSSSDYIIIDLEDITKIYSSTYMSHIPGLGQYLRDLFEKKKNFRLVKVFQPKNRLISCKKLKGVVYPSSLWWNPIPVSREVSPKIYVFQKIKERQHNLKI